MTQQITVLSPWRYILTVIASATILIVLFAIMTGGAGKGAGAVHASSPVPAAAHASVVSQTTAAGSYADIVDQVMPAVVTILTERHTAAVATGLPFSVPQLRQFFGQGFEPPDSHPRREDGLGSGVVVTADGYILTNHHVVDGAEQIQVELADRRVLPATVVGDDAPSDLAVLKIQANGLRTIALADSDRVRVGDGVLAIGNPLGVGQTVTLGIISAKGRTTGLGEGGFEDFLQTDAPINQGNSGGPLVNVQGELVGINSQIVSPSGGNIGIGFAIPSNMVRRVMDQLIANGHVRRARLGVVAQTVTADIAASLGLSQVRGALVSDVQAGSPAARSGLRQGDIVIDMQGHPVADGNVLRNEIASAEPGTTIAMTVLRDGHPMMLSARLEELKPPAIDASRHAPEAGHDRLGMTVAPVTPQVVEELSLPAATTGMVIVSVDPDGPAAAAGLQENDVIEKVNGQPAPSASALLAALERTTRKPALVLVRRRGVGLFVTLSVDKAS